MLPYNPENKVQIIATLILLFLLSLVFLDGYIRYRNRTKKRIALMWYRQLPEDVRQKAIANHKNYAKGSLAYLIEHKFESLQKAISSGFVWEQTSEGYNYWYKIHQSCENIE